MTADDDELWVFAENGAALGTLGILAVRRRPSGVPERFPSEATLPGPREGPAERDGGALKG
ncbi:MAG TPA: hypothetical protein VII43_02490 [Opitutaceae bacterium]